MKINEDLLGKEVVDESGDQVGVVKDVEWDPEANKVESLELEEGGISSKIGLGENKMVPVNRVKSIGDKVLISGRLLQK